MGAFVYMLRCADGSYYVGSARNNDLSQRVAEHEAGEYQGYTSTRRPVRLVGPITSIESRMQLRWSEKSNVGAAPRKKL